VVGVLAILEADDNAQWLAGACKHVQAAQVTVAGGGADARVGRREAKAGDVDDEDRSAQLGGEARGLPLADERRVASHRRGVDGVDVDAELVGVVTDARGLAQWEKAGERNLGGGEPGSRHGVERDAVGLRCGHIGHEVGRETVRAQKAV
jgi:hypothetical protein